MEAKAAAIVNVGVMLISVETNPVWISGKKNLFPHLCHFLWLFAVMNCIIKMEFGGYDKNTIWYMICALVAYMWSCGLEK